MMFPAYTKTIDNEQYIETLNRVVDQINKIVESETTIYAVKNNALITERLATSLRHIVQEGNKLERLLKGQILESAYKAEKSGPNSTELFLKFISFLIKDIIKDISAKEDISDLNQELDEEYERFKDKLQEEMISPTWDDIAECVHKVGKSKKLSNMVLEAVQLAGVEGNIIPGGSANGQYSLELVSGYNFPVTTYPLFTEEDKGRWGRGEVKVLVVDGVIERASEVHKIFTEAYSNKRPHLFVARGYGEEVIATIASNKNLDICPIRIPWEIESINYIADIAVVCGTNIISSMKGDLISAVDYNSLKTVEKVICTKENLNIINAKTNQSVSNHINDLIKRRENTHVEEMSEFINKRIKALNSHTVHIRLGSKTEQQKMQELEAIDFALRVVKGILDKGTVKITEFGFNEKMPTISVLSAVYHGISLVKSLCSVEYAILESD